ncbi:MAG: hypothetical protein ACK4WH_12980 [Phycisphaerales bacterium]
MHGSKRRQRPTLDPAPPPHVRGRRSFSVAGRSRSRSFTRERSPRTPDLRDSPFSAPEPSTRPLALVEGGQRLTHHLRLKDESTPARRAKPAGVLGAEVWVKLVAPPSADSPAPTDPARDPSSFTFLTVSTRTTCRAEFPQAAGGEKRRLHGPLGEHTRREGAVVGGHDRDGGGLIGYRARNTRWGDRLGSFHARAIEGLACHGAGDLRDHRAAAPRLDGQHVV